MLFFDTQVLKTKLNYKIIYRYHNNIFRANCDLDKIKWEVYVNSLVRLPSDLVEHVDAADR